MNKGGLKTERLSAFKELLVSSEWNERKVNISEGMNGMASGK